MRSERRNSHLLYLTFLALLDVGVSASYIPLIALKQVLEVLTTSPVEMPIDCS